MIECTKAWICSDGQEYALTQAILEIFQLNKIQEPTCCELITKLNGIVETNVDVTIVIPFGVYTGTSGTDGRFVLPHTPNFGNKITTTKPNCRIAKIN